MAAVLHLDFETRSAVDLRTAGVYRYMEDSTTSVTHLAWRFGEGPVHHTQDLRAPPPEVAEHVKAGGRVGAHNAVFERLGVNVLLPHWPALTVEQMDCTMARAAALAIPSSLEIAAEVVGALERKDAEGHALMLRMSRPRKIHPDGRLDWWAEPDKLHREAEYCAQDVRVESALDAKLLPLSERERRVWELDQRINDRGVMLDTRSIARGLSLADYAKTQLDLGVARVTGGAVRKCSEVAKLAAWITAQGIPCESLAKEYHENLLRLAREAGRLDVCEAIDLRIAAGSTSVSKLKAMSACVCMDGRARGLLAYHGASTGRWAGRLIQPQNLPRVDPDRDGHVAAIGLAALTSDLSIPEAYALLDTIFPRVPAVLSKCLRAMFIAAPGHRFIGGDLSNIEGCVNAWIAGETWKVEAYRAYQEGKGPDLYKVAYARSFGGEPQGVSGLKRQVGKVQELAFGYQGSIGALISMAKQQGVDLDDIKRITQATAEPEVWRTTKPLFAATLPRHRYHLDIDTWTALKIVVNAWRDAHPAIVQSWWDLQDAAIEAVSLPGIPVPVLDGRVQYLCARGFLWCQLPSGRLLAYCKPRLREVIERSFVVLASGERLDGDSFDEAQAAKLVAEGVLRLDERRRRQVFYEGYDSERKRWGQQVLYGGLQCENICQAVARDVLVEHMFDAEAAGYPIVLTVHDELLTEVPAGRGSAEELRDIMRRVPPWCAGLPLDAKTWEGFRYEK